MSSTAIRAISPADLDIACEVVGLAFADNPNTLAIARGDPARAERIMRAGVRVGKLGRPASTAIVAEHGGDIVGVLNAAAWPECQMSLGEKLKTAPAMIKAIGSALPRAFAMLTAWEKHDPKQAHWHIGPIAVRPGLQGQGIGSTMLGSFLETVDAAGLPAYLETDVDRNVPLYERFGFKIIARADINGVDNRFLWRAAAQSQPI